MITRFPALIPLTASLTWHSSFEYYWVLLVACFVSRRQALGVVHLERILFPILERCVIHGLVVDWTVGRPCIMVHALEHCTTRHG